MTEQEDLKNRQTKEVGPKVWPLWCVVHLDWIPQNILSHTLPDGAVEKK